MPHGYGDYGRRMKRAISNIMGGHFILQTVIKMRIQPEGVRQQAQVAELVDAMRLDGSRG